MSVGALPSENCERLIKKYGKDGTHLPQQQAALEKIKTTKPQAPAPYIPPPKPPEPEPAPAAEASAEAAPAESAAAAEEPKAE
jgi:small subunit ribosomal protein S16